MPRLNEFSMRLVPATCPVPDSEDPAILNQFLGDVSELIRNVAELSPVNVVAVRKRTGEVDVYSLLPDGTYIIDDVNLSDNVDLLLAVVVSLCVAFLIGIASMFIMIQLYKIGVDAYFKMIEKANQIKDYKDAKESHKTGKSKAPKSRVAPHIFELPDVGIELVKAARTNSLKLFIEEKLHSSESYADLLRSEEEEAAKFNEDVAAVSGSEKAIQGADDLSERLRVQWVDIREFRRRYEEFCNEKGIQEKSLSDSKQVITEAGLNQVNKRTPETNVYRGIRLEPSKIADVIEHAKESNETQNYTSLSETDMFKKFLDDICELTGTNSDYIMERDLEYYYDLYSYKMFQKVVDLPSVMTLESFGLVYEAKAIVATMTGVVFRESTLTFDNRPWYIRWGRLAVWEFFSVLIHLVVILVVPLPLLCIAWWMQDLQVMTTSLSNDAHNHENLVASDLFGRPWLVGTRVIMPLNMLIFVMGLVILGVGAFEIIVHYYTAVHLSPKYARELEVASAAVAVYDKSQKAKTSRRRRGNMLSEAAEAGASIVMEDTIPIAQGSLVHFHEPGSADAESYFDELFEITMAIEVADREREYRVLPEALQAEVSKITEPVWVLRPLGNNVMRIIPSRSHSAQGLVASTPRKVLWELPFIARVKLESSFPKGHSIPGHLRLLSKKLYFLLVLLFLGGFIGYLVLCVVWIVLGAVLNPTRFLPYAAAAATGVGFAAHKFTTLKKLKQKMTQSVMDALQKHLASLIEVPEGVDIDADTIKGMLESPENALKEIDKHCQVEGIGKWILWGARKDAAGLEEISQELLSEMPALCPDLGSILIAAGLGDTGRVIMKAKDVVNWYAQNELGITKADVYRDLTNATHAALDFIDVFYDRQKKPADEKVFELMENLEKSGMVYDPDMLAKATDLYQQGRPVMACNAVLQCIRLHPELTKLIVGCVCLANDRLGDSQVAELNLPILQGVQLIAATSYSHGLRQVAKGVDKFLEHLAVLDEDHETGENSTREDLVASSRIKTMLANLKQEKASQTIGNMITAMSSVFSVLAPKGAVSNVRELFKEADVGSKGYLSYDEFKEVLRTMHIKMTETKSLQLYAEVDLDASGAIDLQEFEASFELLKQHMSTGVLDMLGLSTIMLVQIFVFSLLTLVLIFVFLFFGINAYATGDAFGSVVNSALPIGSGAGLSASGNEDTEELEAKAVRAVERMLALWLEDE
eukprot:JP445936.1.p1 GENE.JP445936.1~~JP445936.1.p1  ORF type:complete len:1214 (+),score=461.33 JP445936.1:282-3923(+)